MKQKRDATERMVVAIWWGIWGAWGLIAAVDFAGVLLDLPWSARLWIPYWPLLLAPLHLATLGFLAARRHVQGRDD